MPEPLPRVASPPPSWPAGVPAPQTTSLNVTGPARASISDVMSGPLRLYLTARTAPARYGFTCWLTREQFDAFEAWYTSTLLASDGEFYAPWIGGGRVLAFVTPYQLRGLGRGWQLTCNVARTRLDPSLCDAAISAAFGNLLIDNGTAADVYLDDGVTTNIVADDFPLTEIAAREC